MVLTAGRQGRAREVARGGAGHRPAASPLPRRGFTRPPGRRDGRGPRRRFSRRLAAAGTERGSQALEFVMVLPMVALALGLVVCAGLVGAETVHAHGVAREAARAAAVGSDARAAEVARAAAGAHGVSLRLDPPQGRRAPGDLVTAEVGMPSRVLARAGIGVELRASATMQVEAP